MTTSAAGGGGGAAGGGAAPVGVEGVKQGAAPAALAATGPSGLAGPLALSLVLLVLGALLIASPELVEAVRIANSRRH